MLNENFVWLALIINSFGGLSYFYYTVKGRVKPNRVTWFLWGAIPLIGFSAQITQGVGIQSLLTFVISFIPFLIFFASFLNKNSYWKVARLDIICGLFSIFALVLWYITKIGNIAILFSLIADGMAAFPTIVKAFKQPETENYLAFFTAVIAAGITMLTIKNWNFATFAWPLDILVVNLLLAFLIKSKIGKKLS